MRGKEVGSNVVKSVLSLAVVFILSFSRPAHAQTPDLENRELIQSGNSQMRTGTTLMWTGAALFPVSALALVPVLYDGAFGITAADPGFAIFFALAGGALIHAGIPIYGFGVDKLEQAWGGSATGEAESAESGWSHYRRSWAFLGWGSAVLAADFPFAVLAALKADRGNSPLDYSVEALGVTGLGLLAAGVVEQHYSQYRFVKAARRARGSLKARTQVSLNPILHMQRQSAGAGLRLTCSF
jgi:hypothetical protein